MKILYLNYSGNTLQIMRVSDVARGLRAQGHEVILKHMHRSVTAQIKRAQHRHEDAYVTTKAQAKPLKPKPRWLLIIIGEIRRALANYRYLFLECQSFLRYRPDMVLIRPAPILSIFISAFLFRQKLVFDTDGPMAEIFEYHHSDYPRFYLKMERIIMKRVKSMSVISSRMKEHYSSMGGDPNRIFICPNGIDPERFKPEIDASAVRDKYHLNKNTVIGFMGNLEPWHGLPGLLNQFPSIAEKYENVRLLLVGITLDWDNLPDPADSRLIEYRDRIICTGRIPFNSMPEHLKAIDIFVLPYPVIDFFYFSPIKLFESMGVGCAVVAAGIGQIAEVIHDGKDGLLFQPGNYNSMESKIEKLIEDPGLRNQLGKSAAENIHSNYTWQKITEGMIRAFNYTYG